ncbi:xrn 5 -3 exonuclease amine-terminal protein, partial [Cystoisospora suis]
MMNGNDYLPKLGGFTFSRYFDAYTSVRQRPEFLDSSLINPEARSFNPSFFLAFLDELDKLSSLRVIALQQLQILPPQSRDLPLLSPLAMINQLVAQKAIVPPPSSSSPPLSSTSSRSSLSPLSSSLSVGKRENADRKRMDDDGEMETGETGKGLQGDSSDKEEEEEKAKEIRQGERRTQDISEEEKEGKEEEERGDVEEDEDEILKWRMKEGSPKGLADFTAILRVHRQSLPAALPSSSSSSLSISSVSTREKREAERNLPIEKSLSLPSSRTKPLMNRPSSSPPRRSCFSSSSLEEAPFKQGDKISDLSCLEEREQKREKEEEDGEWLEFVGRARDKRGARQQAAQKLLEDFFPSLHKQIASVVIHPPLLFSKGTRSDGREEEEEERMGEEELGDSNGLGKSQKIRREEGNDEDEEEEEEKTEEEREMERDIEKHLEDGEYFRSFIPSLIQASYTLLATTPSNTLNNLSLKVFKAPPTLLRLIDENSSHTSKEEEEEESPPHRHKGEPHEEEEEEEQGRSVRTLELQPNDDEKGGLKEDEEDVKEMKKKNNKKKEVTSSQPSDLDEKTTYALDHAVPVWLMQVLDRPFFILKKKKKQLQEGNDYDSEQAEEEEKKKTKEREKEREKGEESFMSKKQEKHAVAMQ